MQHIDTVFLSLDRVSRDGGSLMGIGRLLVYHSAATRILPVSRFCLEVIQAIRSTRTVSYSARNTKVCGLVIVPFASRADFVTCLS